jgi:hypothetical protein
MIDRERAWTLVSAAVGLLGAMVVKRLMRAAYELVRRDPDAPSPFDPTVAGFSWPNALAWAAAAGIGLGAAKVISARVAVAGWEAATHSPPPGLDEASG